MSIENSVSSSAFYNKYHGHKVSFLKTILPVLRSHSDSIIWTAGDSCLDNKYWFDDTSPAPGAYQQVLDPPTAICDVTYWLNKLSEGTRVSAINTAVATSTLNERTFRLRPQDIFLRDNIKPDDTLVVSVGGEDVGLTPCPCTIVAFLGMLCLPPSLAERSCSCGTVPVDDYCCGCGASLMSCTCAMPPCAGYFAHLFGTRVHRYIQRLTVKTKPCKILVCMTYFPDETRAPSFGAASLGAIGYNRNPKKLQTLIRMVFEMGTSKIRVDGSHVIPVPLYLLLDGQDSSDYVARVEPSGSGGKKVAEFILALINSDIGRSEAVGEPSDSVIQDRS